MTFSSDAFVQALASATEAALIRVATLVGRSELDVLAYDVHPWSGTLNLSMRLGRDPMERLDESGAWLLADWTYAHFAIAHEDATSERAWPEAKPPTAQMQAEYERLRTGPEGWRAADGEAYFHRLCAEAAARPEVWTCLRARFVIGTAFVIAIPGVDRPDHALIVSGPT